MIPCGFVFSVKEYIRLNEFISINPIEGKKNQNENPKPVWKFSN